MHTLFSLQTKDFLKGLLIAVLSSVFAILLQMLNNGFDGINLKQLALVAITSGLSYLLKNYLTDSNGKILGKI